MSEFSSWLIPGLLSILFSCNRPLTDVQLGDNFELKYEQSAVIEDDDKQVTLTFTDVLEDSRCPVNVLCAWEGRVVIAYDFNDRSYTDTIASMNQFEIIDGYNVELLEVNPYPQSSDPIKKKKYSAVFKVWK